MGEHHRPDYAVSSRRLFWLQQQALQKNIKLASGVTVLSSSEPVKVYEDFSTLDLISDGRAEIFVGRGSFIESFPLYGYSLNDYEQLFDEKLELLLKINSEENVSWSGKLRAPMQNQTVYPRAKMTENFPSGELLVELLSLFNAAQVWNAFSGSHHWRYAYPV